MIFTASDHAGFGLKNQLVRERSDLDWVDLGPTNSESVDYPDYARAVCDELEKNPEAFGVLICGSGQGMAMAANRYSFIRAALCVNVEMAQLARAHNNANVLCLGARTTLASTASQILSTFLTTQFEGGRHERRVQKLSRSD